MISDYMKRELALVDKAAEQTSVYFTPLISSTENIKNPEFGSGTFVIMGGKMGILTNAHVADLFIEKQLSYVTIPHQDLGLSRLPFYLIISLPVNFKETSNDVDMAFILLTDDACRLVYQIGKRFWDIDRSFSMWKDDNGEKTRDSLWLIHAVLSEGKKFRCIGDEKSIEFKNSGYYVVVPDFDNIEKSVCSYSNLGCQLPIDNVSCPIVTKNVTPKSFCGMSGSALWEFVFNHNAEIEIFLIGLATQFTPAQKAEKLICRGPITLYRSFYPFVLGVLFSLGNPRSK